MLPIGRAPEPDFARLLQVLRRQGEPDRVPFVELGIDREILETVLEQPVASVADEVRCWHALGYDYVSVKALIPWVRQRDAAPDTAARPHHQREWVNVRSALITTRADFDAFPFPRPRDVDYSQIEQAIRIVPPGMGVIGRISGVLENSMWTLGFEGMAYLLADQPALVRDTIDTIGALLLNVVETLGSIDGVGAIFFGEDMGFKTATMVSPAVLRQYLFPWHRRIVRAAHAMSKPIILHSCGNVRQVMDDILDAGWDARHSYEDVIEPITEAKGLYGDRIALLGGIDMDLLTRGSEQAVRERVRQVVAHCAPGGGFAIGSGNTVANYIPLANYLAMLDEAHRCGRSPFGS